MLSHSDSSISFPISIVKWAGIDRFPYPSGSRAGETLSAPVESAAGEGQGKIAIAVSLESDPVYQFLKTGIAAQRVKFRQESHFQRDRAVVEGFVQQLDTLIAIA